MDIPPKALSVSARDTRTWRMMRDNRGRSRLLLNWVESGVDVQPDKVTRRGYGRELIENALAYALRAKTEYVLGEDGVRCRIELPVTCCVCERHFGRSAKMTDVLVTRKAPCLKLRVRCLAVEFWWSRMNISLLWS